ncbi:hypothetical protein CBLAS_1459 [Campylobacter blaseri]|uniref:Uncharacterized protein n=1 Tax=Campylobacter blaseri TaxID=2042961 RepID=A0A2P8QZ70_9BACT|nr:hypothetical protein [Campylobacter blaseri]PSM51537.1 hypothetical protein CQ405_06990 [Campylobacter blaseri]PSM53330.1 hypothetical protein CRN67_06995 [Campylobacter blaseri]QKF86622.1 hypothetical protein CBLAS_1459 [Campylobacter blaseri]
MKINFSKSRTSSNNIPLGLRDIFMTLPLKDKTYKYPRDVQAEVWEQWFKNHYLSAENIIQLWLTISNIFEKDIYSSKDIHTMTLKLLNEFRSFIIKFAENIAEKDIINNVREIEKLLISLNLNEKQIIGYYKQPFRKDKSRQKIIK